MTECAVRPIGRVESALRDRATAPKQGIHGAPIVDVKPVLDNTR